MLIIKLQHSFLQVCGAEIHCRENMNRPYFFIINDICITALNEKSPQGVKCIFFLCGLVNLSNIKSIPFSVFSPFPAFYSFLPQCMKPDRSINSYLWGYQVLVWRVRILVSYHNWDDQCIHILGNHTANVYRA